MAKSKPSINDQIKSYILSTFSPDTIKEYQLLYCSRCSPKLPPNLHVCTLLPITSSGNPCPYFSPKSHEDISNE